MTSKTNSRRCNFRLAAALLSGTALASVPLAASAEDWTGATSVNWYDGANWSTGAAPDSGTVAIIDTVSPNPTTLDGGTAGAAVLTIGENAGGALTLINSAALTVSGDLVMGASGPGASGTMMVTGTGSAVTVQGTLYDGDLGTGQITVQNGAVIAAGGTTYLGHSQGSTGSLAVDGAGSKFTSAFSIYLGGDGLDPTGGNGTVSVTNGGTLSTPDSIFLGLAVGSTGALTIDGTGSSATATGIDVGYSGTGIVTVRNGGAVTATVLDVGGLPGATGSLAVTGAGSYASTGTTVIGDIGVGTLAASNGGQIVSGVSYLGYESVLGYAGNGSATVDGVGSSWVSQSLDVGYGGSGRVVVSNGGVVAAATTLTVATQAGSTGEIDIGAAPGSAPAAPGAIVVQTIQFGAGTGTLNFNHTSAGMSFDSAVAGFGTINQIAGVTAIVTDDSGFTGATNITGGALRVIGSLRNSAVTVAGGMLTGTGSVGSVAVQAGGIVAPGNSTTGTLTVNGNYSAASGSVYQAQLDSAGRSDLLQVNGAATIANGAVLDIANLDGAYVGGTRYTLLTATGGVSGTYTVTGDVAQSIFAGEKISYDAHDVYLDVVRASFASVGGTPNQIATGAAADTLPLASPVYAKLAGLPSFAAAQGAFDQLSGEIHASARTALVEDSRFVREAALDRLQGPQPDHPVIWGQGFGDWGSHDGNGNAAGMDRSTKGFIGGVELPVIPSSRIGILGGYSRSDIDVKDRNSAASNDNYHLGVYGNADAGPVVVRAGMAYSWNDLQTVRVVAFGRSSDQLTARYNGGTTQAFGEIGHRFEIDSVSLEPFANLAYVGVHTDAFGEAGGPSALSVGSAGTDTSFTTLGLHARDRLDLGSDAVVTLKGSLGWRHDLGGITPVSTNAFAGSSVFTIDGVPIARDAANVEAGFDAAIGAHLVLGLSYAGQYAADARDNGIKADIAWTF